MIGRIRAAPAVTSRCYAPAQREVDVARKVAFLSSPRAYADRPVPPEIIETHFSWVFLTDRHVYKLKKPVRSDGVDFTTVEARQRNAEAEVRLNRRLAPDVYLGVVPLTLAAGGGDLTIGGEGVVVDRLVKMVRLPAERMLDRRLARSDWHYADIHALAGFLAKFFVTARPVPLQPMAYLDRFRAECGASRHAFYSSGSPPLQHAADRVVRYIWAFMARRYRLLLQRVEDRRIVEGHGDLRPEHICLGSAPRIIDCLEFRLDLRSLDPVDELAFLAMECERLGARSIGRVLFRHYCGRTGDCPPPVLIAFYKAIGALIRGRIAILHLQETPIRDPAKWLKRAADYLQIARRECRHLDL